MHCCVHTCVCSSMFAWSCGTRDAVVRTASFERKRFPVDHCCGLRRCVCFLCRLLHGSDRIVRCQLQQSPLSVCPKDATIHSTAMLRTHIQRKISTSVHFQDRQAAPQACTTCTTCSRATTLAGVGASALAEMHPLPHEPQHARLIVQYDWQLVRTHVLPHSLARLLQRLQEARLLLK